MGARKRIAAVIARFEQDADERKRRAEDSAERAQWVERLSDELALAFTQETGSAAMHHAQRRAHGRVIEQEGTHAALLKGASTALFGAANEIRAVLAGHGTSRGMDRARHELLGKYGPTAISIAKRHRVGVDAMMCAVRPLVVKIGNLNGEALELADDADRAAAELFGEQPEVAEIVWPSPPQQPPPPNDYELEAKRVAKKLEEREAEKKRQEKAAKLAKKSKRRSDLR